MSKPTEDPAPPGLSYRDAGVDIDAMNEALAEIKTLAGGTATGDVLSRIGGFGGLFAVRGYKDPVLVASVDGVGTKLKVAIDAGIHHTVGADLVNHCINDILVQGAVPLFFMDYFATGRLEPRVIVEVVRGMAGACREAGCALLGGETAEMPGFYGAGDYDVAGFIIGMVEKDHIITGETIRPGDVLLGLPSTGLHTNGYSLARKILFERRGLAPDDPLPGLGTTVAKALLAVHRSYLGPLRGLIGDARLRGLAHITGGGITDNLPRILPAGCGAEVDRAAWEVPPLFRLLQEWGGVSDAEMARTFNLGIGMIAVVRPGDAAAVSEHLRAAGETPAVIGRITAGDGTVRYVGREG